MPLSRQRNYSTTHGHHDEDKTFAYCDVCKLIIRIISQNISLFFVDSKFFVR